MHTHSQSRPLAATSVLASLALAVVTAVGLVGSPLAQAQGGVVGRDWTLKNPAQASLLGEDIYAVVSNGASSNMVAVGGHGLIQTSPDGIVWTRRISNVTVDLNDVVWVNAAIPYYVTVGLNSTALISTDEGVTWTAKNTPHIGLVGDDLLAVALVNNSVLAVGGNATSGVVFSLNGLSAADWIKGTTGVTEHLTGIASPGGTTSSVIVAITPKAILTGFLSGVAPVALTKKVPTGGLVLTTHLPFSLSARVQGGANNLVLCTTGAACKLWKTADGIAWTDITPATLSGSALHVRSANNIALATGPSGDCWTATSLSSGSWTHLSPISTETFYGSVRLPTTPNPTIVAVGEGGRIFTSVPAVSNAWTSRGSSGSTINLEGIATNGAAFVGVANGASLTSPDTNTWTAHTLAGNDMRSIVHTGSQYVAVGKGAWTSADGIALTQTKPLVTNEELNRAIYAGGQVVAVGFDSTVGANRSLVYLSDTGATWTKSTVPTTATTVLNGIAATPSGGALVAVGNGGNVITSSNYGFSWTKRAIVLLAGEHLTDVTFGNNLFVAVTSKGGIWTSPNGTAWTKRRASSVAGFNRIFVAGNQLIAIGNGGHLARSFGGTAWVDGDMGTSQNMTDALYNGTTAVAVGELGAVFTSTGTEPARPTLNFAAATSTVLEDAGTKLITLNLTPAAGVPVTVIFTLGGTAINTIDYTVPITPITFAPGELSKTIAVTIKKDIVDEIDETLKLSLGAPTGDALLGSTRIHTLTITDVFPTFTVQPVHKLVVAGTTVTENATVTGASGVVATWKKNGLATVGLVGTSSGVYPAPVAYTGTIANVQTTHAGAYTLSAVSTSGTKVSDIAQLGVVENTPVSFGVIADTTITLTAKAGGNGLSYQWLRGGVEIHNSTDLRITGTNTNKLLIKNCDTSDTAQYVCRVTMTTLAGQLTQSAATSNVNVVTSVPRVTTVALPSTTIAQAYSFQLTSSEFATGWDILEAPASTGLNLNTTTGLISGKVSFGGAPGGNFTLTVAAKNVLGTGSPVNLTLHVDPLPVNSVGTFYALINRDVNVNQNLGAYLELTTSAGGAVTGKLYEGATITNFTGSMTFIPGSPNTLVCSTTIAPVTPAAPAGLPVLPVQTLSFTLTPSANLLAGTLSAGANSVSFTATPANRWTSPFPSVATDKQGKYNFAILPGFTSQSLALDDKTKPQGAGYGAFTIIPNGTVTIVGQTADGNAYSRSGVLTTTSITATLKTTNTFKEAVLTSGTTTGFYPGMIISPHAGISPGTTVQSIEDETSLTLSDPAIDTIVASATFGVIGDQVMFYAGNYNTLSSMHGTINILVSGSSALPTSVTFTDTDTPGFPTRPEVKVTGTLTWLRMAETAPRDDAELNRERFYRDGFRNRLNAVAPISYRADGALYFTPRALTSGRAVSDPLYSSGILMNVPDTNNNAHLVFKNGSLQDTASRITNANIYNDPDINLTLDAPAVVFNNDNIHTTFTSATLNVTSGIFSGRFDLKDNINHAVGTTIYDQPANFRGLIIRQFFNNNSVVLTRGYGYFLMPHLPEAGEGANGSPSDPATNSRVMSGIVILQP